VFPDSLIVVVILSQLFHAAEGEVTEPDVVDGPAARTQRSHIDEELEADRIQ